MRVALVAVAGAAGAVSRYAVALLVGNRLFPWPTLAINVSGSFLLGLLLAVATRRGWPTDLTVPLTVGFLGAYTTFSTFSQESAQLVRDGRVTAALAYVAVSAVVGIAAAAAGHALGVRAG